MKTHIFKNAINILASTLLIVACEKDAADETNTVNIKGYVQKGPFFNGSTIQINELDNSFEKKGKIYTTVTTDNKGSFALNNIERSSPYYEFCAQGFYFNEVLGDYVDAPITLYALADSADISEVNVNILTHLEKNRVEYLIKQNMSFPAAKDSAQREILSMFGFALSAMEHSEKLDISVNKEENAVLLAVSLILQGKRSVSRLDEVLQPIIADVNEDGILNDEEIKSVLYKSTQTLDLAAIRRNLEDHYKNLGMNDTIPGFEKYINAYLVSQKPFSVEDSITNVTCNGAKNGKIDITIIEGTPPFTYSWSNGAKTEDISNIAAGKYTVTIGDASNYFIIKGNMLVTEPPEINISGNIENATCESNDGSIDVTVSGGAPPYLCSWSNGATTEDLNTIKAGKYTITVKDADQCSNSGEFVVNKNQSGISITGNASNASCESSDGSIDITVSGGMKPYLYSWSNGATTEDLDNIKAGKYAITVTDANQCSKSGEFVVNKNQSGISITGNTSNASCENNDGSIDVSVTNGTPPYLYSWSNGATTEDLVNIKAGVYMLTVTEANLCSRTKEFVVDKNISDILITGNVTNTEGESNAGAIDISVSGGTPPYLNSWSNGATTEDIMNLSEGKYTITVIDANLCSALKEFMVYNNAGVTDFDGNKYKIISIGTQVWMSENLKAEHYRNGDLIPEEFDPYQWQNLTSGFTTYLASESSYIATYGRLYNYFAIADSRNVCPVGWHVPLKDEWTILINYLGGSNQETVNKLIEAGNVHWQGIYTGNNESGFTGFPGGRFPDSGFYTGTSGSWWSSSEYSSGTAWSYTITDSWNYVSEWADGKYFGFSVRCVKD